MGLLFAGPPDFSDRYRRRQEKERQVGGVASSIFVGCFSELQKEWKRQGLLRRTHPGKRATARERYLWAKLIEYTLTGGLAGKES